MKLDNRGWGLQELLFGLGILLFCLLLITALINRNFKKIGDSLNGTQNPSTPNRPVTEEKDYKSYAEIEDAMESAASKYNQAIYGTDLQEGDNITVTLKSLIRDNYMKKVHDIKNETITCSGYVTFIKEGNTVTYHPYLKCGNKYKTKGFLDRLDAEID